MFFLFLVFEKVWSYKLWRKLFNLNLGVQAPFLRVKSDRSATSSPSPLVLKCIWPKFWDRRFSKIVQVSFNNTSGVDTTLRDWRQGLQVMLQGHKRFYGRGVSINFGGGSFEWKLKVLVPSLGVNSDRRESSSPYAIFSPKEYDRNFEITILFRIVQRS